jgi:hypothetical protein
MMSFRVVRVLLRVLLLVFTINSLQIDATFPKVIGLYVNCHVNY